MDGGHPLPAGLAEAAETYCRALHAGDVAALRALFLDGARLWGADAPDGLTRDDWLDRVAARAPEAGSVGNHVEWLDASGPDTGIARIAVRIGGRGFVDYLNFVRLDGAWRVVAKVYHPLGPLSPAPEGA